MKKSKKKVVKVLTVRMKRKHIPSLCALIPGLTAHEVALRCFELGLEVLQQKVKAATN